MKPGLSSLNPYAVSYIPLSQRRAEDGTYVTKKDSYSHGGTVWFQNPLHITVDHNFVDSNNHGAKKLSMLEAFHVKSQPASSSYSLTSQNATDMTEEQMLGVESDMDMEYLRMSFPGISDRSLSDVYMVNKGDLDAAMDMLSQLEFGGVESSGNLPETLDIGDVSEFGSSADSASLKLKSVVAQTSISSSPMASANVSCITQTDI